MRIRVLLPLFLPALGLSLTAQAPAAAPRTYRLLQSFALPTSRPLQDVEAAFSEAGDQLVAWGAPAYAHNSPEGTIGALAWRVADGTLLWERLPTPRQPLEQWVTLLGCGGVLWTPTLPPEPRPRWEPAGQVVAYPTSTLDLVTGQYAPLIQDQAPLVGDRLYQTHEAALFLDEDGRLHTHDWPRLRPLGTWDPPSPAPDQDPTLGASHWFASLGMSPKGHRVVAAWRPPVGSEEDLAKEQDPEALPMPFRLLVYDAKDARPTFDLPRVGRPGGALWVSHTGAWMVRAEGTALEAWNLDLGLQLWRRQGVLLGASHLTWSEDDTTLIIRTARGFLALEAATGQQAWRADLPEGGALATRNGTLVAIAHRDPRSSAVDAIQVWTLEDPACP